MTDPLGPLGVTERKRLMQMGRDAFNQGQFFEAHEHWEAVWDVIDDPERRWLQGLIQVATGLHKLQEGRSDVAIKLLTKALVKLDDSPNQMDEFDLKQLRMDATAILDGLKRGERPSPKIHIHLVP